MGKMLTKIDNDNYMDLLKNFADKNKEALSKKTKLEIAASLMETSPDLILTSLKDMTSKLKKYNKAAQSAGFDKLGSREYKSAVLLCIKSLLELSVPELVISKNYEVSVSLSAKDLDSKVIKALSLYSLASPKIKEFIVY